ncbi:MAG: hypothetical protein HUJ30_00110, partial [Gammaproteobacteria bacterium]|nr:hypothetical protein [Gammaproteobacteria bacterium]
MSQLVVKEHDPKKKFTIWSIILGTVLLSGWGLFEYGRFSAGYDSLSTGQEMRQLEKMKLGLERDLALLSEQKTALEQGKQIEQQAYDKVRNDLKELQDENLELKEELAFYRGIVSPKEGAHGLRIQGLHVTKNAQEGSYQYKLVLKQEMKN